MADLVEKIERAAGRIDPGWTEADVARGWDSLVRRRRRRVGVRIGLAAGAACAGLLIARALLSTAPEMVQQPSPGLWRLADGSVARALDAVTEVAVREDSPRTAVVELARGRSRFEVVPRKERRFSVRAGDVTVTVLGTVFTVERIADRIGVVVDRGRVLVAWKGGERSLAAGESGWFPPLVTAQIPVAKTAGPVAAPAPVAPRPVLSAPRAPAPPPVTTVVAPPPPAPAAAGQLLAAADEARLAGRPADAVAPLQSLLRDHSRDPRAPLAAFTLGRVLLTELGRAREAAAAFASARALAPRGQFAEDALAREVEAWAKAGETAQARARAEEYRRVYPDGRRLRAVRELGGLE